MGCTVAANPECIGFLSMKAYWSKCLEAPFPACSTQLQQRSSPMHCKACQSFTFQTCLGLLSHQSPCLDNLSSSLPGN